MNMLSMGPYLIKKQNNMKLGNKVSSESQLSRQTANGNRSSKDWKRIIQYPHKIKKKVKLEEANAVLSLIWMVHYF
jgi:hypothetical protein